MLGFRNITVFALDKGIVFKLELVLGRYTAAVTAFKSKGF